jgi:hypothetical protein
VNDIEILQEMLISQAQVPLQQVQDRISVELTDTQAKTTVVIKELPQDSIVIKTDVFELRRAFFSGSKDERRRADYVIVSHEDTKKWIICIETKKGQIKQDRVIAQLRGAQCVMDYCKSIGKEFWTAKGFLEGYEYRFVGIAHINVPKQPAQFSPDIQSQGELHNRPDVFLQVSGSSDLSFHNLIDEAS